MTPFPDLLAVSETPAVPAPSGGDASRVLVCAAALESIGHLQKKIELMWGSAELDVFISRLIMDSREGARQGLPMQVAAELVFLAEMNKLVRAFDAVKRLNLNWQEAYRLVDKGDQSRLESDALDNPLVSRDTITRRPARQESSVAGSQRDKPADGFVAVFWRGVFGLIRSKWLAYFIIGTLGIKLWPRISALLHVF